MVAPVVNEIQDYIVEGLGTLVLLFMAYQIYAQGTTMTRLAGMAVALVMMGYKAIGKAIGDIIN